MRGKIRKGWEKKGVGRRIWGWKGRREARRGRRIQQRKWMQWMLQRHQGGGAGGADVAQRRSHGLLLKWDLGCSAFKELSAARKGVRHAVKQNHGQLLLLPFFLTAHTLHLSPQMRKLQEAGSYHFCSQVCVYLHLPYCLFVLQFYLHHLPAQPLDAALPHTQGRLLQQS